MDEIDELTWWQQEFSPSERDDPVDYIARDGRTVVQVQKAPQGTRGLYNGVMQLALLLSDRPEIKRACLVLMIPRLSMDRVRHEWMNIKGLFHPRVSDRLSLVAIGKEKEDVWVEPNQEFFCRIAKVFQAPRGDATDTASVIIKPYSKQNQLEVLKVLMHRWLLREGAIRIGKLAEQVGCAQLTVRVAVERLERQNVIRRRLNRSVELFKFPLRSWNELLALSGSTRHSFRYRDASGERTDLERLLKRLERMRPSRVALGGVAAARHWHSDFDLHGIPRLDLLLHTPGDNVDLDFVKTRSSVEANRRLRRVAGPRCSAITACRPAL